MEARGYTQYDDGKATQSQLDVTEANTLQGVFTKVFLQFPHKFWFDTEVRFIETQVPNLIHIVVPDGLVR